MTIKILLLSAGCFLAACSLSAQPAATYIAKPVLRGNECGSLRALSIANNGNLTGLCDYSNSYRSDMFYWLTLFPANAWPAVPGTTRGGSIGVAINQYNNTVWQFNGGTQYNDGNVRYLSFFDGHAINDLKQVAGSYTVTGQAAVWPLAGASFDGNNVPTNHPILIGQFYPGMVATARAISSNGSLIAGTATAPVYSGAAIVGQREAGFYANTTANGGITALKGYGAYRDTHAEGINNSAAVVGCAYDRAGSNEMGQALIWRNSNPTPLGGLGGQYSCAFSINDAGVIVGIATNVRGERRAFVSFGGTMVDLNSLLVQPVGAVLYEAYSINASGQIAANATDGNTYTLTPYGISLMTATPTSGNGSSQTFTLNLRDTLGAADVSRAYIEINSSLKTQAGCGAYYDIDHGFFLIDDGTGPRGPAAPGSNTSITNSQCSLDASKSTVVRNGNFLTVNFALHFDPTFQGAKQSFAMAEGLAAKRMPWIELGTWTVPPRTTIAKVSTTPNTGAGRVMTFSSTFRDTYGATDISASYAFIGAQLNTANSCAPAWDKSSGFYLAGSPRGVVENTYCKIDTAHSTVSTNGTDLTVTYALQFKGTMAGTKTVWVRADGFGAYPLPWTSTGSWVIR